MKVLVLGGYGLIGAAVVERLLVAGHDVVGLGRDVRQARARNPLVRWVEADMAGLLLSENWLPLLEDVEAVVNAAGALQDGARDNLDAIHRRSVVALVAACEQAGVSRFVQISAVGADRSSGDAFFSTKAEGDHAVERSSLSWTILRPGLVIAPAAYGGTALLRALAAFPGFMPAIMAQKPIQTVSIRDVAEAVRRAIAGDLPHNIVADLVEDEARPLSGVLLAFRAWLGLPAADIVPVPLVLGRFAGLVADGLGRLGWRSPLRSSALAAMARGVTGDPERWRSITGLTLSPLERTLATMPAPVQERWFARLWLLKPVIFACLSLFWLASGMIGLLKVQDAADILTSRGISEGMAYAAGIGGGIVDIFAGAAVLVRSLAKPALLAMIAITAFYLAAASLFAPGLWLDPLGPLVKVIPGIGLALVALAVLDER